MLHMRRLLLLSRLAAYHFNQVYVSLYELSEWCFEQPESRIWLGRKIEVIYDTLYFLALAFLKLRDKVSFFFWSRFPEGTGLNCLLPVAGTAHSLPGKASLQ